MPCPSLRILRPSQRACVRVEATGARALRLHALCALRLLVLPPCLRAPGQRGKLVRERLLVARPSSGS